MTTYQLYAHGPEVSQIQTALAALGLYHGPIDGDFGGGTLAAVKAFQRSKGLPPDGVVGAQTWGALFPTAAIPAPALLGQPLPYRCLALTGSFETGSGPPDCFAGVAGDFDHQGMSFGAIQWNLGQGTLQPLLRELVQTSADLVRKIFDTDFTVLQSVLGADPADQMAWARSIQAPPGHVLFDPWQGYFKTLGRQQECQVLQVKYARGYYDRGVGLCTTFDVHSERAVALMFDISVQNGDIKEPVTTLIRWSALRLGSPVRDRTCTGPPRLAWPVGGGHRRPAPGGAERPATATRHTG